MTASKYPLEPLVHLREQRADEATRDLAAAVRARESASARRAMAEAERRRHAEAAAQVRADETERLARGLLTAADLMRAASWEERVLAEAAALDVRVALAGEAERAAVQDEARVRGALSSRKADLDVVEKDRARFADRAQRAAEARDEEGAGEAWRPGRGS